VTSKPSVASDRAVESDRPTKILVLYGTTEGQTRKIARFIADRLTTRGHEARLVDAAEVVPELDPRTFDAAVIAASLDTGHYQSAVVDFFRRHRNVLDIMPTTFVSVSLSAASHDADDLDGLARCLADFEHRTRWMPREVHHAAGAFRFTQYEFLKRWAMKYIAYRKGQPTDTSKDYELTDWDALGAFVDGFAADLAVG
jgi:menaquinone-dependent protoporphyrinogen oxidase